MIKSILKKLINLISSFHPKDKSLVLIMGTSIEQYNENARYFYEYLVNRNDSVFKPMWITQNEEVYHYLKNKNWPVMKQKSVEGLFYFLKAGFIIGTGIEFPNLLSAVGGKTVKLCLHHASGPRSTNAGYEYPKNYKGERKFRTSFEIIQELHKWDYFNFTSKFMSMVHGKLQYLMPTYKRLVLGYPRMDHLFKHKKVKTPYEYALQIKKEISPSTKIVLFAPTFRIEDTTISFPINLLSGFNLEMLDNFLMENDLLLLVSRHPYMNKLEDFSKCKRIQYIFPGPLFDINLLLPEVSVLITDYSSIATDFAVMDRPILYVLPDYDSFLYDRGLIEDMRASGMAGKEALNFSEFLTYLKEYSRDFSLDSDMRTKYLQRYYDLNLSESCKNTYEAMVEILKSAGE